ncbi:MAG: DNA mismatch repair protein MutS [Acidithiobacillales bacterium SM23_46]|jgi:DNA-nicking Smr family endonuclease|nr:MAG: DNA mismatch repair protein MutS [Acidithiobacillales bacterium SM23_46]
MSKHEHDPDARTLFRKAAAGAKPIVQDRAHPHRSRPKPVPAQRLRDDREVIESLLSDAYEPSDVESGEELLFARSGLQHGVLRKLRRGHYAVEAHLDLHGQTVAQAREHVSRFLREARSMGKRCVRIVHGKGKSSTGKLPVLKGKVNSWLRQRDEVLAFSSCPPTDGGTGAVYVLLRRRD